MLLDSGSDENDTADKGGVVQSPTRLVETAEGSPSGAAITLRPASPHQSLRPATPVSPGTSRRSVHPPTSPRQRGVDASSVEVVPPPPTDSSARERLSPSKEDKKKEKKGRKAARGLRSGSSSNSVRISRDIPLACTAVASFCTHPDTNGSVVASLSRPVDGAQALAQPRTRLSVSGNGMCSFLLTELPAAAAVRASKPRSSNTLAPQLPHESLSSSTKVEAHADAPIPVNNGQRSERGAGNPSGGNHKGPGKQRTSLREEAMRAFPASPAAERLNPAKWTIKKSARLHSPVAAPFPTDTATTAATVYERERVATGMALVAEALRKGHPPPLPPPPTSSPLQKKGGRVLRLVKGSPRHMRDDVDVESPAPQASQPLRNTTTSHTVGGSGEMEQVDSGSPSFVVDATATHPIHFTMQPPPSPPARRRMRILFEPERETTELEVVHATVSAPKILDTELASPLRRRALQRKEDAVDVGNRTFQAPNMSPNKGTTAKRTTMD